MLEGRRNAGSRHRFFGRRSPCMKEALTQKPRLVLLNWVTLSKKHMYQIRTMHECGYQISILTADYLTGSQHVADQLGFPVDLRISRKSLLARIGQTISLVSRLRSGSFVLVPAAGRFSPIAILIARFFGRRVVCIEWGDIGYVSTLPRSIRWSMFMSYRLSNLVWYKEPFMQREIIRRGVKKLHYLPNAVPLPMKPCDSSPRHIDFVWANRLVPGQREPSWFVEAASVERDSEFIFLGFLDDSLLSTQSRREKAQLVRDSRGSVNFRGFEDPHPYFAEARYFVLFSRHVFGNNALLEAMSMGVVPIVSKSEDVDQVVIDEWNGFVCLHDRASAIDAIRRAVRTPQAEWEKMSANAVLHVERNFSVGNWSLLFDSMVKTLESRHRGN